MSRPRVHILTYSQVARLRNDKARYTWEEIAARLECSRMTVIRAWQAGPEAEPKVKVKKKKAALAAGKVRE